MLNLKIGTLGFVEWKYIARWIKKASEKRLRDAVLDELNYLVEAA